MNSFKELHSDSQLISYKGKGVIIQNISSFLINPNLCLGFLPIKNLEAVQDFQLRSRLKKLNLVFVRLSAKDIRLVLNFVFSLGLRLDFNFFLSLLNIFQNGCFFIVFPSLEYFYYFSNIFKDSSFFQFFALKSNTQIFLTKSTSLTIIQNLNVFNGFNVRRLLLNFVFLHFYFRNFLFFFLHLQVFRSFFLINLK